MFQFKKMKKLFFLLLVQFILISSSNSQFAFKSLLSGIKDKVKEQATQAANNITNSTKDAVNKQANNLQNQVNQKITDASTQIQNKANDEVNNQLGKVVIVSQKFLNNNVSSNNTTESSSNMISPDSIDKAFKADYPLFYQSYLDIQKNDPLIKNIIFGYKEGHKYIYQYDLKKGILFFDLYFFENSHIKEESTIYYLFLMVGHLHFVNQYPQETDLVKKFNFVYEFALTDCKNFANDNNCDPLKYAINDMNQKGNDPVIHQYNYKNDAAKLVLAGNVYKDCNDYISTKCKN